MKKWLNSFFLTLIFSFLSAQNVNYEDYFQKESLRVDFLIYGSHKSENAIIHQLKKEPYYGGGTSSQLFSPDYGEFKILAYDKATQRLIFSKGFSPIFQEWQATDEAKSIQKAFENSIQIPFPKHEIMIEIKKRNKKGRFETVMNQNIDPNDFTIIREKPKLYPTHIIQQNGLAKNKVDIVIIPEGYTEEEMPKFIKDTERLVNYMFTIPPFTQHQKDFNIIAIKSPSEESGTDIPGENVYKNTLLNSKFYTFGEPRYLTTFSNFKIADIAANIPYDQIYVLVNTSRYGGGGFYNVINLVSSDHELSDKVFVHEFGHGFVGLGDEYYDASFGGSEYYPLDVEPWEPNLTTLVDFDKKWRDKIKRTTPIPTPRTKKYSNEVGVFEGGGYTAKGVYSPVQDCRMKSNEADGFCPVCSDAISQHIEFYKK
ncbi:IgA Peptidase M64 [Candidatus Ornithobacterium hominis]|uniref:M64 family metallopeptidase n=1 Tax=Candidatus Ornithobacterium hominis TaxID=2497989 RepID=UPI000E5C2D82|nr:M64 family metallopeptidase [Candidatus Ornithobacterium hominis]SZD71885.1 IgA Peptidase M64 [Candidatus Ornithobacterium hominis]